MTANSIKTTLKGEVIDRSESTHLILFKDFKNIEFGIEIPVVDGKFEYVLHSEHKELYYLAFNDEFERGTIMVIPFFSEPGVVKFTLFPMDRYSENRVKGGKLNKAYWNYWHTFLDKNEKSYTDLIQYLENNYGEILEKQEMPTDHPFWDDLYGRVELLEEAGIDVRDFVDSVWNDDYEQLHYWKLQYIKKNPTLVGYTVLVQEAISIVQTNRFIEEEFYSARPRDISPYIELYQTVFAPKFPNHPYTEQLEKLFAGPTIKIGVPFVDFTAPDLNDNPVTLSEQIAGKPAVLHLWASLCGPCLRTGKELIPVYEEFRDKGFIVIGVAQEREVADAEATVKRLQFPWENLVDLKGVQKIWEKYEVEAAGAKFLIDENGIIVAINPSVEEIRSFLIHKF